MIYPTIDTRAIEVEQTLHDLTHFKKMEQWISDHGDEYVINRLQAIGALFYIEVECWNEEPAWFAHFLSIILIACMSTPLSPKLEAAKKLFVECVEHTLRDES